MKKILFIGPIPPPVTGQSIAFSYLKKLEINNDEILIFNTQQYKLKILNYLYSISILPFIIFFTNCQIIYFIGSRSKFGFLRQFPFLAISIFKNIRLVNHLHGADFKSFYLKSGLLRPLIHWVYNQIDTTIILLEQMRDQFEYFPDLKLKVVPNAVDDIFDNISPNFPKKQSILYLSNIMASKGIIEFMKASKILLKNNKKIEINIAGGFLGDHLMSKSKIRSSFYELYQHLKVEYPNQIEYHGIVQGEKKLDLLGKSSLFILPTYYPTEAYPISIIEAMATGNAIITTKHNYLEKIISVKQGGTIKIKDSSQIVSTIKKLFSDQQKLQIIQRNNMMQSKNHNIESHLKQISKIITND